MRQRPYEERRTPKQLTNDERLRALNRERDAAVYRCRVELRMQQREIAARFGISKARVSQICFREEQRRGIDRSRPREE